MKNKRMGLAGLLAIGLGAAIFFGIRSIAGDSNDPAEVIRIGGQAGGAVAGLGVALIAMSFFIAPRPKR